MPAFNYTRELLTRTNATKLFTRPADTTAYAVGDAVGPAAGNSSFALPVSRDTTNGDGGYIQGVRLSASVATIANASFRLYFFTQQPSGDVADNAVFAMSFADSQIYIGEINLPTMALTTGGGGIAFIKDASTRVGYFLPPGQASIWTLITAQGAYVPASGQQFFLSLAIEQC